jgi:transposase
VREKLVCRACEAITQPPAPSHPIARGRAGPKLLAHVLFAKNGLHLPLNRQSDVYRREGIDVSTLAGWVGASAATLMPLVDAIQSHVFAAERIHADDTTVPVLAKGKTRTGRLWTYVPRSPGHIRQQPCSSIRRIVAGSIRNSIWRVMPG